MIIVFIREIRKIKECCEYIFRLFFVGRLSFWKKLIGKVWNSGNIFFDFCYIIGYKIFYINNLELRCIVDMRYE